MKEVITYNFGAIKETVTKLITAEMLKQKDSETLRKFNKELKESSLLKKQFLMFKNIETAKPFEKERLAERFITQNLRMFDSVNWNNIISENKRIRRELVDNIHVESRDNTKLFECVHVIIEAHCNPNFKDFQKEQESYDFIINHLTREVISENKSKEKEDHPSLNKFWEYLTKYAVDNFEKRYEHLNESERSVFKALTMNNDLKSDYLDSLINECIEKINSKKLVEKDKKVNDILNEFEIKLLSIKESDNKDVDESILYCFELKESI